MKTIVINQQPIELYKILKLEALVYGGGEAKMVIAEGLVKLNGITETQKRKKVLAGDTIEFDNELFMIELAKEAAENTSIEAQNEVARIKQLRELPTETKVESTTVKKVKRRPIQF